MIKIKKLMSIQEFILSLKNNLFYLNSILFLATCAIILIQFPEFVQRTKIVYLCFYIALLPVLIYFLIRMIINTISKLFDAIMKKKIKFLIRKSIKHRAINLSYYKKNPLSELYKDCKCKEDFEFTYYKLAIADYLSYDINSKDKLDLDKNFRIRVLSQPMCIDEFRKVISFFLKRFKAIHYSDIPNKKLAKEKCLNSLIQNCNKIAKDRMKIKTFK
ncbi:hypothetical protein [Clostridium perfringens]|nr:hypothetical protein [Clostridium perfringens]